MKNFLLVFTCVFISFSNGWKLSDKVADENNSRSSNNNLEAHFKNPPHEARPQAWWWWLQTPTTKEAITLDLEEMKAKGLSGCMVLDGGVAPFGPNKWKKKTIIDSTEIRYEFTDEYNGGTLEQAKEKMEMWSEHWREMVRFASKEAGRLGLDFGVFIGPAGCAAPWVTPEYGQQEMVWGDTTIAGGEILNLKLDKPQKPVQTKRQAENELVKNAQNLQYTDIAILAIPEKATVQLNELVDLTDKLDEDGNLRWNAPTGNWKILRFGYRPTGRNLNGVFYIDHLSKEVFDLHWENTAGLLLNEMSPEERKAFGYVECDSWEAGDPNWTKYFAEEFKKRRGYDIVKFLPVLVGTTINSTEESDRFQNDFKLTISDLISENHYEHQRDVAHQHGLQSYAEAAGPHQFQSDLLKCVGRCDVAMGEFWMPSPHREKPSGRFLVREAATAAHIYGINRVFAESFTSVGPNWEESPFLMKAAADQAFCDGLNWICFHTFSHRPSITDVPGMTHSAGTHFDRTITWWNQSASFVDYLSRCSHMLQQGLFVADVLFYKGHGMRSNGDASEWEDGLKNPPSSLGIGYDYDKCNEEVLLTRLSVENGKLVLPDGLSYSVLVLDTISPVSFKAMQKLVELAEQGATIVGKAPGAFLGNADDADGYKKLVGRIWGEQHKGESKIGKGRFVWNATIREALVQKKVLPDFEVSGVSKQGVVDFIHRETGDTDIYFVSSRWQPVEKVECTFRVTGKQPELWNPVTGEIRKLTNFKQENGRTIIPIEFDPCGSYFIVFQEPVTEQNTGQNWASYQTVHQLKGSWEVRFDTQWGGPASATFEELGDWTMNRDKGIKYYSGKATYHKTFDMSESFQNTGSEYYIDLGEVHEVAEVRLNGEDLGVLWTKPFKVNITSALKEKGNKLEIDVVNLWPNRLIGDEFLPEDERYTSTNIRKFTKATKLLRSGLIGPVRIQTRLKNE
ncbi:glycosyl hydrolase [Mangrovibacterium sp.]|uniref:glycosyl hydrolase n=1 Tax=Mangrovibacterium sp. TaxID=1961364 RepID=UPI003564C8F4